jgi:cob(I)alamin adenosyltransferase
MDDTITDIEDLHQHALSMCSKTYIDPATGFTVFTELQHLKRGFCCGNKCRHCPYGFANVKNTNIQPRPAKLKSGDMETAQRMMQEIMEHGRTVTHATTTESSSASTASTVTATTTSSTSRSSSPTTTTKNVPYTRTGDSGTSQLLSGERRSKDDANFEALGSVDELCTFVGVAHAHLNPDEDYGKLPDYLLDVMSRLFDAGSHVAKPQSQLNEFSNPNGVGDGFDARHIDDLEVWINEMTEELPELTSFILPTGAAAAAHLHVARTVCRRAERRCVTLVVDHQTCDPNALKYLNRLSDFLFTASRWVNYCEGEGEYLYRRDTPKSTQRQRVARSLQHEE